MINVYSICTRYEGIHLIFKCKYFGFNFAEIYIFKTQNMINLFNNKVLTRIIILLAFTLN